MYDAHERLLKNDYDPLPRNVTPSPTYHTNYHHEAKQNHDYYEGFYNEFYHNHERHNDDAWYEDFQRRKRDNLKKGIDYRDKAKAAARVDLCDTCKRNPCIQHARGRKEGIDMHLYEGHPLKRKA